MGPPTGVTTEITPAQVQAHFAATLRAGMPLISTAVGGAHGAGTTGTHGAGASAAATAGFDGDTHIPKVLRFAPGRWSLIVAIGTPVGAINRCGGPGTTVSGDGVVPIVHMTCEPVPTSGGITCTLADSALPHNRI